jgi:hypothetical protein
LVSGGAKRGERRIMMARNALAQWRCFAGDEGLTQGQTYVQLKAGLNAFAIVVLLLRSEQWLAASSELWGFWKERILRPRLMFYHLFYAMRLRRLRA